MWTERDIHIEVITIDNDLWEEICSRSSHFFHVAVLPELVAKFFSRLPNSTFKSSSSDNTVLSSSTDTLICYCEQPESGEMVGCDNHECEIKWFHFECVQISKKPKSKKWYCPDCRKLPQFKRGKKSSAK